MVRDLWGLGNNPWYVPSITVADSRGMGPRAMMGTSGARHGLLQEI
jgi:hypothetical protein